ncbi:hypothetical protein M0R36_11190, partial [bacterium]|nr:hypothetical protein [bacterium]
MINSKAKGRSIIDLRVNSLVNFKIYSVDKISKIYTKKDKHCFELSGDTQHKLILKFWDREIAEGFHKNINDIMNLY